MISLGCKILEEMQRWPIVISFAGKRMLKDETLIEIVL